MEAGASGRVEAGEGGEGGAIRVRVEWRQVRGGAYERVEVGEARVCK